MKKMMVSLFLVLPMLAFASEPVATKSISPEAQRLIESTSSASGAIENVVNPAANYRSYTCTAWTDCANGRRISCEATGAACRSRYSAGRWVSCQAWGSNGSYSYATDSCY